MENTNKTFEPIYKVFAKRITEVRQQQSITQKELARRARLPLSSVREIEKADRFDDEISFCLLNRVAKALDVHPAELIE